MFYANIKINKINLKITFEATFRSLFRPHFGAKNALPEGCPVNFFSKNLMVNRLATPKGTNE